MKYSMTGKSENISLERMFTNDQLTLFEFEFYLILVVMFR